MGKSTPRLSEDEIELRQFAIRILVGMINYSGGTGMKLKVTAAADAARRLQEELDNE